MCSSDLVKCKVPKDTGYWPAFWLWGGIDSTIKQEIDILEMNGDKAITCDLYESNVSSKSINYDISIKDTIYVDFDLSENYYIYAAEWTPHMVIFYRDNVLQSIVKGNIVPDLPMKVILNLAIDPWTPPDSNTFSEKSLDVEYVKIYSLKRNCNDSVVCSNFNFVGYDYSLVKLYRISNSVVPLNIPVTLRATDEIELQAGFEVPDGAEFCAMITECY